MAFQSEYLWCFESEVATLTRSVRLTKVPQVITEEIGDKKS